MWSRSHASECPSSANEPDALANAGRVSGNVANATLSSKSKKHELTVKTLKRLEEESENVDE